MIFKTMFHVKHIFLFLSILPIFSFAQGYSVTLTQKKLPHPITIDSTVDNLDRSFSNYNQLNETGKELLYWTNYSRKDPKRFWDSAVAPILNALPELNGNSAKALQKDLYQITALPLFQLNTPLINMAQFHANETGKKQLPLSHNSADGSSFGERFSNAGLKNCGGENIAISDDVLLGLVLLYIDYNLPDAGHRKNLLSEKFSIIGIGACPYGKTGNFFFVQDFACPQ